MNRGVSLGPDPEKRSCGEPVLETLDHAEAKSAAGTLADLDPDAYRPFNLVIADTRDAYWLRHGGDGEIRVYAIPPGLHMLSDTELDNTTGYPRIRGYLQRFRNAEIPDPQHDHWQDCKTCWRSDLPGGGRSRGRYESGRASQRCQNRFQCPHRRTSLSGIRIATTLAPCRGTPGPLPFRAR